MPRTKPDTRPFVLSIPAGVAFLDCLAEALLDGGLLPGLKPLRGDPLALAGTLVFVPTRRAGAEFAEILARRLGGAAVLPRILPLGTFDEDEDAFAEEHTAGGTVGETERRLVLARLIRGWAKAVGGAITDAKDEAELISTSPGEAVSLAIALGQLIDSFETEQVGWDKLAGLVPEQHDEIWRLTADFLNIAAEFWPKYLAQENKTGAAARRNAQLRALAESLEAAPPQTPVIIAGSTGSNPATADLMRVVARLPFGGVILHGLDVRADAATWKAIGGDGQAQSWTHPQHAFHRLLAKLDVQPGEVGLLGREDAGRDRRRALVSQALLPSDLTDRWQGLRIDAKAALEGVTLIEAANEREEATAIAVALRETLEQPGKTAALITPDRNLARRVAAELKRWDIEAEDSAGLPLGDSRAGILALLVAEAAAADLAPRQLLALLRHPDARFGMDDVAHARAVDALDIGVLRGPAPPPGPDGLLRKLTLEEATSAAERRFWHRAKQDLRDEDWEAARNLIATLRASLDGFCAYGRRAAEAELHELLEAHRIALAAVRNGAPPAADADMVDAFFDEGLAAPSRGITARLSEYPVLFRTMLRGKTVRGRASHPRLRILGTLEARLLGFDRTVLGGLNEGTWPAQAQNDAFLSRPMRHALGLPPPEWRTGQSAHDFEQALGGKDVVLTRAQKAGGAPAVAARWLQRLAAVSGAEVWGDVAARGDFYLAAARALDRPPAPPPRLEWPEPRPPRELRPRRLSVTEIETLIRDPYAIYARHVLELMPMEEPGALPGASDRGTIIHAALAEFSLHHDVHAPDAERTLIEIGRAAFKPFWDFPDVRALWWPRFEKIARWFIAWERERRPAIARTYTESRGVLDIDMPKGGKFRLAGRADRIDALAGGYAVIDYKTGAPPGDREVRAGFAPQLPLEAAMLAQGAFDGIDPGRAVDLMYVRLSGQNEGGDAKSVDLDGKTAHEIAEDWFRKLVDLINVYDSDDIPYLSQTRPKFSRRGLGGDYDHLARFAEWSLAPEPEEGGDEG